MKCGRQREPPRRWDPAGAQYCTFEGPRLVKARALVPTLVEEFFKR
jgi:hypothetical protein